jgi:hypothetical protein
MQRKCYTISIVLTIISLTALCQSEQLAVNITHSSLPGVLTFENPKGSIKVTGYDGDVILITGTLRFKDPEKADNGMHRIIKNALNIWAEAEENNINLMCATSGKTVDFDIKVPDNFSLKLKSLDNGNVDIININGEIEIENANGDISLENISGSAVLSSVYGKISAVFRKVDPGSPMMFTSLEGSISVTFPESINATFKIQVEKGEILSDFDMKPVKRQPVVTTVESTRIYTLEDWVVGLINKGGPEYIFKSYNGNIVIRKK